MSKIISAESSHDHKSIELLLPFCIVVSLFYDFVSFLLFCDNR